MSETRVCRLSGQKFVLSDKELAFYQKMKVPPPTLSPIERLRLLMAFRNEWKLYRRKCDATGKEIISAYPPDSPFTVYNNATWWGDTWDARSYGRDFDFQRPFFDQFAELQKIVPREGTTIFYSENCDYNSHIRKSKNCYLNSLVFLCEDVAYSYWMGNDKDCFDCIYTNDSTLCYECNEINRCYNCVVLYESNDCNDCFFSYQLQGCHNCFFCTNLVRKEYHIFNKPVSKEEFLSFKEKIFDGSWSTWQKAFVDFLEMKQKAIQRCVHTLKCENVTGDHIYNSKNCVNCFDTHDAEDCFHCVSLGDVKDVSSCYSAGWTRCELIYYSVVSRGSTNVAFCNYTYYSTDMRYCDSCNSCQNCFGCIGLQRQQYCILNKQYSKENYEHMLGKIIEHMSKIGEWGEFFPPYLSPYAFNETAAIDSLPLSKKEATKRGWKWREENQREYQPATLHTEKSIQEILTCLKCKKNYRIIPKELKFYRTIGIPLPRECPECRHTRRMCLRNPIQLWERSCAKCQQKTETSYAPGRPEIIYCERCYLEEVYGFGDP